MNILDISFYYRCKKLIKHFMATVIYSVITNTTRIYYFFDFIAVMIINTINAKYRYSFNLPRVKILKCVLNRPTKNINYFTIRFFRSKNLFSFQPTE